MTLLEATIKKNFKKNEEEVNIKTAKNLLERGVDIKIISESTGLSEAKMKSLAKKPTKEAA